MPGHAFDFSLPAPALGEVVEGQHDEAGRAGWRTAEIGEPGGEPSLGRNALGEFDPLGRAALGDPVEGGDQIGSAEPEGERLAGADRKGGDGPFIGMTTFGASGPYKQLYELFGITAAKVAEAALARLGA